MTKKEIKEAIKIIKEPITVNSIEYKYFTQENYEKLLRVYENCQWFINNWEQMEQNIEDLQKKAELADHYKHLYSEVKKQKDDVVNYIKYLIKRLEEFDIPKRKETGAFWYQVMGELEEILRMLGEIDVED